MKLSYKNTMVSCFVGYVVLAVINNFIPLLFVYFENTYAIPLRKITLLITINFCVQLFVDFLCTKFVDRIGYRASIVFSHICAAAGLVLLTVLPQCMDPFLGILIAVVVYAVGGGVIEVLVSPIVESCPTDNKEKAMSLLHSFYCWGHVGVVLLSSLFFRFAGIEKWWLLALLWAVIPIVNGCVFVKTPIATLLPAGEKGMSVKSLFKSKAFWVLMLMMLCAGASEQSVVQWVSAFAEKGLGVPKAVGDLAGPLMFAVFMGCARAFYGKFGDRIDLRAFMLASAVLCVTAYVLACLVPSPVVNLIGCGLCGLSVGILWPGTFSLASKALRTGGTAMFALLALTGDLGCSGGPTLVGMVSDAAGGNMKAGLISAIAFPGILIMCLLLFGKKRSPA